MATDPVCGMFVEETPDALRLTRENREFYFCSSSCLHEFAEPAAAVRRLRRRLAVAWPLAAAVVVLSYAGADRLAFAIAAVLAGVVQFGPGAPFYRGAWDALRHRIGNMDLLVAVGTTAAFGYSAVALALPGLLPHDYFFDASAVIVALILTGSYLEHRTRSRAGSAVGRLAELLPREAIVVREGVPVSRPVSEIQVGDRFRTGPGGRIPADGVVRIGRAVVDESILTGEGRPVPKAPGDRVLGGSLDVDGPLEVEATGVGQDLFLSQVGRLLTEAEMSRVPARRTADRIASIFAPATLALALGAGIGWVVVGHAPLPVGVLVFVTVAVTACPCAFGLATPAAILVGAGAAADSGILFRGASSIESTATLDVILLDKTGTLTGAASELVGWKASAPLSDRELLGRAAGLEQSLRDPFAVAVRERADAVGVAPTPVENARLEPGAGPTGVGPDGLWSLRPIETVDPSRVPPDLAAWASDAARAGGSIVTYGVGPNIVGALAFRSRLVPGADDAVRALRSEGVELAIVSGDAPSAVDAVARPLGIGRTFARQRPEQKVERVRAEQAAGRRVGFVGDGVNDAAALAAADAGFALGTGTDVAREAGSVLLVRNDLRSVATALRIARRTVGRVRSNLVWALGYNAVLLPIAAGALVPLLGFGVYDWLPFAGAVAMALSSTTVLANSLSLRRTLGTEARPRSVPTTPSTPAAR